MINLIPFQGTTSALKELEAKELFNEEKVGGPKVKGIEAKERTFIASQSERSMLESLSKSLDGVDDIKKLRSAFKKLCAAAAKLSFLITGHRTASSTNLPPL